MKKNKSRPQSVPSPVARTFLAALAVALLAVALYAPSLHHPFLALDDNKYVSENPLMRDPSWATAVGTAFAGQDYCYWHPLTVLSLYMESRIFGLNPMGFHAVSLLLHAANAVLLLVLFRRLTGRLWPSALMAALFAAHPVHVESVAWITERKDVLSTFFFLLTILAYHRFVQDRRPARYLLVFLSLALGLMAKPMLASLPAVLLLLDYWPLNRLLPVPEPGAAAGQVARADSPRPLALVLEKLPLFALALASVAVSFFTLVREEDVQPFNTVLGLKNAAVAYLEYLRMLVWPSGLGIFHPFPSSVPAWQWAGSLAVLLALTGTAVWLGRSRRYLLVGWFWFLGAMIPALKTFGGGLIYSTASRFAYVPFIGLYLILAFGAEELARRGPALRRGVVAAGVCAVAALFLAGRGQLVHWQDSLTLFRHTIEATGGRNPYMRYSIGLELERRGDRAGALQEYRLCLADDPDYVPARLNVGNLLLERGRLDEASREYQAVLDRLPEHYYALANLGVAAFLDGRREEGEELTRRAMARDPGKPLAYANLARMRRAQGDLAAARVLYRQALEREPENAQVRRALEELGG